MKMNMKKLAVAAMLTAVAVALSTFSIPIGASKCFPIQHLCNVIAGVFLGPWYGVAMAFCTSLIRNLMGTGSLLAFPGSMVGAFLGGFLYRLHGRLWAAYVGGGGIRLRASLPYEYHVRHGVRRVPHGRAVPFRRIYLFKTYAGSGDSGSIVGGSGRADGGNEFSNTL